MTATDLSGQGTAPHIHNVDLKTARTGSTVLTFNPHSHTLTEVDKALAALTARVAALEALVKPTPTPVPASRPWAAPTVAQTVAVPASIDGTGATDVAAQLDALIAAAPNGSLIQFPAGKTYKLSRGLRGLAGKSNLIIDLGGSTLNNVANANASTGDEWWPYEASTFFVKFSDAAPSHITIRNGDIEAASPAPGTYQFGEYAAAFHFQGGTYIEIMDISAMGLFGDFLTLNENAQYVWEHGNTIRDCGRNSVSVVCASHVLVENDNIGTCGYCVFDVEPETGSVAGSSDLTFRYCLIDRYIKDVFFALDGSNSGKPVSNVTVSGNSIGSNALVSIIGYSGAAKARPSQIRFSGNTSLEAAAGPVVRCNHVDGVTVTGNTQPLLSGQFAAFTPDCTGVSQ